MFFFLGDINQGQLFYYLNRKQVSRILAKALRLNDRVNSFWTKIDA